MDEKEKEILINLRKAMEEAERNKSRRSIYVILLYSAFWFLVFYGNDLIAATNLLEIIANFAGYIIFGGATFLVNAVIFSQLQSVSESENKRIRYYENQLREYDKKKTKTKE